MGGVDKDSRHTAFLNRLEKLTDEEIFAQEKVVGDLLEHPGYEVVKAMTADYRDSNLNLMLYPPHPHSQAEYARFAGITEGIERQAAAAEAVLIAAQRRRQKAQARVEETAPA